MKMSLIKKEAKQFIELQEAGDIIALQFYRTTLSNKGISDGFEVYVVHSALTLNAAIIMMEQGTAKYNGNIDTAYREIMCELVESARAVCEYEV